MAEFKAGTLVWVKRKNGSWWPGRIMGRNELSSSSLKKSGFAKPVQLLGRQNSSVDWYNIESKRIKAFRCNEFNDFIKKAESMKVSPSGKLLKYAHRTDAILHALELESKELGKKRKMTDCRAEAHKNGPVCRSKRSRCVYLSVGSRKRSECTSFHAQPLTRAVRMGNDSYRSISSENNYSSRSTETYSSDNYTPNGGANKASKQLSGCCSGHPGTRNYKKHEELSALTPKDQTAADVQAPKRKITLKLKHLHKQYRDLPDVQRHITFGNAIHDGSDSFTVDDALKYHTRTGCYGKQSKKLIREMTEIYFSSQFQDVGMGIPGRRTRTASSRKLLIDIKLTFEAHYEGAPVPLVSLMSKANRNSIIGYPIEVEQLKHGSTKILLPINDDDGNQLLDDKGTSLLQSFPNSRTTVCYRPTTSPLTWSVLTTARRTPVSYLPTPPSIQKDFQAANVPTKEIHARPVKREINSLPKEMLLNLPAVLTCVPVKLIFSRLVAAVGLQPGADIHGKHLNTEGQLA